jgi:hypothetical protein
MSLFSEIIGGQQAQAQEPRNRENQYMQIQQFMADQQAAKRKAMQDQQMFNMTMGQNQQAQQLAQQDQANKRLGMQAYLGAVKERAMPGVPGMPNVNPTGVQGRPDLPTMSFDTVAQSILKKNPKITPEAFSLAMEKFAPQFEAADKMKMAQLNAELRKSVMGPDLAQLAYQNAKAQGLSEQEAIQAGIAAKRAAPKEVGEAERARQEAKVGSASELEKQKASGKIAGEAAGDIIKKGVQAGNMNDYINQAREALPQATGSGAGALMNMGKRFAGVSDESTQANQKLKLIGGWMMSNVPRMEGPQSNFDVQNYREMAGVVGDETVPVADRMKALDQLEQLNAKYANLNNGEQGGQSSDMGQNPASPATNYSEGMTATNPRTGEKLTYRGGAWVKAE